MEKALRLEASIPPIKADAAAGRISREEAAARIGAIRVSVSAARDQLESAESLAAELTRRSGEAGRAVVEAMFATRASP